MRLEDLLTRSAGRFPSKVCVVEGDRRVTFAELDRLANQYGRLLLDRGVRRGDRVVILLDNGVDAVAAVFGTLRVGAIFSLLNPLTKGPKIRFVVDNLSAAALVTQARYRAQAEFALADNPARCGLFIIDDHAAIGLKLSADPLPAAGIDQDLAYIAFTSGSTGVPKGVMMTHQSSIAGASAIAQYLRNTADDIVLSVIPLAFDYGLYQVITMLLVGGTVCLEKSFAFPQVVLQKLAAEKATGLPLVPTTISLLLQQRSIHPNQFPHLRYITNTAAPLPPAHSARLQELFPGTSIYSNYGLTETIRSTYLPPELLAAKPTSVGKAAPNSEAFVVDESGQRVAAGVVGELVFRGSSLFRGYWANPEATAAVLKPGLNPWEKLFHTGDLFYADPEGDLYFVGRVDDMIKSRGEKVSPREVENVLYALEGIQDAAVIGTPDPILGQAIKAFVVPAPGSSLTPREIKTHCMKFLEDYMVPQTVEFVAEIPKTESGKIKRRELISDPPQPPAAEAERIDTHVGHGPQPDSNK
jgi:long-chain acyl-CoA synthetase